MRTNQPDKVTLRELLKDAFVSSEKMQDVTLRDTPIGRRSENIYLNVTWLIENTEFFKNISKTVEEIM